MRNYTAKVSVTCEGCGSIFMQMPCRARGQRFCDRACQKIATEARHRASLTVEGLRAIVNYDRETGIFTWREDGGNGKRVAGARAGYPVKKGYRAITVGGHEHFEHRLAWFYVHGIWPKDQLDHWDTDRSNNALRNLREANNSQNQWNSRTRHGTITGLKGVTVNAGKFVPQIHIGGKQRALGRFNTPEEAKAVYDEAALKLRGEFARLG